jgi:hypothetical protein
LNAGDYNHLQALREILFHQTTRKFLSGNAAHFPAEDPIVCLQRDIHDFVLRAKREADMVIVERLT